MNRQRLVILWSLIALFAVIAGIFVWSRWHDAVTKFLSGTRPEISKAEQPPATLPPLRINDPARGSIAKNAVVIIEFGDFNCPTCQETEPELKRALQQSSYPARLIWRDLPIISQGDPNAMVAAVAGRCAKAQGKFWELHDAMLASGALTFESIRSLARGAQINPTTFEECLTKAKDLQAIGNDVAEARAHRINSAPTIFVGNEVLTGFHSAGDFLSAIARAYHP